MSNDSMGNLEKLGILVIVILVVVVGVVAITPSETLFGERETAGLDDLDKPLTVLPVHTTQRAEEETEVGKTDPVWPPIGQLTSNGAGDVHTNVAVEGGGDDVVGPEPAPEPIREKPVEKMPVVDVQPPAPVAPAFREVTVQKDDSLWILAERELGSGAAWRRIAAANPEIDPDRLRVGQVLRIPLSAELGGSAPTVKRQARAQEQGVPASGARTYVVQRGDSFMSISAKLWDTTKHFRKLMEFNGITDERSLRAGATLRVPDIASAPSTRTSADVPTTAVRTAPATAGVRTYTVKRGDTLIDIARSELKDGGRWREILELNGMSGPSDLKADATIRLPR